MKMRKVFLCAVVTIALPAAYAQPAAEAWEATLAGTGSNNNDIDAGYFGVSGSVGYYFTKEWLGSLRQSVLYVNPDEGGSNWSGSTRAAVDYHFDLDKARPLVGFNLGAVYGEDVDNAWVGAPEVGLKYYVKDDTFLYGLAEYQWELDRSFSDGQFFYTIGFGINW